MVDYTGFFKQVGTVLVVALVLGSYPLYLHGDSKLIWSVATGCGIGTVNVLAGCLSILWGVDKPNNDFLKILFGGMLARMMGIGLVVFLLVKFTSVHVFGLIISLFIFYVLFQILEIRFLTRCLPGRQVTKEGVEGDG